MKLNWINSELKIKVDLMKYKKFWIKIKINTSSGESYSKIDHKPNENICACMVGDKEYTR